VFTVIHSCFVFQVVGLQSWHARSAALSYLQVMVFMNYFNLQQPKYKESIRETVMHLICDDKLEVITWLKLFITHLEAVKF